MVTVSPYLAAHSNREFDKKFKEVKEIIDAVQQHMFPDHTILSSSKHPYVIQFVFETLAHKSFDKDIRAFVIEGAKELIQRTKGIFAVMSHKDKEKALRAYEETAYGSAWLSRIMTLTLEAMLSDPIYGVNKKAQAWKTLDTSGGEPSPQKRYLDV